MQLTTDTTHAAQAWPAEHLYQFQTKIGCGIIPPGRRQTFTEAAIKFWSL